MYPVQYAITPETFPIQVRSSAVGLCNSVNTLASILGPFAAAFILENISEIFVILLFFSIPLILAAILATFVLETKDFEPSKYFSIDFEKEILKARKVDKAQI